MVSSRFFSVVVHGDNAGAVLSVHYLCCRCILFIRISQKTEGDHFSNERRKEVEMEHIRKCRKASEKILARMKKKRRLFLKCFTISLIKGKSSIFFKRGQTGLIMTWWPLVRFQLFPRRRYEKNTDSAVPGGIRVKNMRRERAQFMSGSEAKLFSSSASVGM